MTKSIGPVCFLFEPNQREASIFEDFYSARRGMSKDAGIGLISDFVTFYESINIVAFFRD